MANFVALTAFPSPSQTEALHSQALEATRLAAFAETNDASVVRTGWSSAALFPRWNQSGSKIAYDPATESWLAVVGTCFHESGTEDPKYLLRQFLERGASQLARSLEGFFVIVAGHGSTHQIEVITDIVGSCHVYSRRVGEAVVLSSSSRVLASLSEVSLDPTGCCEFLGTGIIYEDRSLYTEVKKLPPASVVVFRGGEEVERRLYWDVSSLKPESLPPEAATEALWSTLVSAAAKIGRRYENIVCDLTGGYDSRATVAAFVGAGVPFKTVVSGPENSQDVIISRGLARRLGLDHLHNPRAETFSTADLTDACHLTDGEYDIVEYSAIAYNHRRLAQQFDLSINGSFGELARGYWWELLAPNAGECRKLDSYKLARKRYAVNSASDLFRSDLRLDFVEHMAGVVERSTAALAELPNTFQMDVAYLRMRMHRWQGRIASSTNKLWPCLSPFMFRSVVETMIQANFAVRQRSLLVRKMLARYVPAMAEFPLEHGYPALPATAANIWRFWPIAPYYAGRVLRKLQSYRRQEERAPSRADIVRLKLRSADDIKMLMDPQKMKSASILDASALSGLLKASQAPVFAKNLEWNRLLSIEMAAQAAEI